MTRIAGFLLLQLAAALYAHERVTGKRRELETLRSFCDMLEQLRGLLEIDASPMPELLETLSKRCKGDAALLSKDLAQSMDALGACSFQELWSQALNAYAAKLDSDTLEELDALGTVLGRYDLETQLDAVTTCHTHLRASVDARQLAHPQDMRLTIGVSLSAALLLGILLI